LCTDMGAQPAMAWQFDKQLMRGNAGQQILQHLKEQILVGQIASGTKLPSEKELATQYGVSAPTVRNAMRGLASAGLIVVRHGSGAFVTADPDGLIADSLGSLMRRERVSVPQTVKVAVALNGLAAELAAENATEEDLEAMQKALDDIERATAMEEVFAGFRLFLSTLAKASANPLLAALCRSMVGVQLDAVQMAAGLNFEVWRQSGKRLGLERQAVLDAIRARNADEARSAAKAYYERASKVISTLQNNGGEDSTAAS
jgi:GntR family transcriptional regulator, transcriptional repressor for pyruvate dehydrogenase complex